MLYRLRTSAAYRYFEFMARGLDDTPPLVSDPRAECEVHSMLGSRDVTMYVLAIKSLLSYVPRLAVVVHSDGSLSNADLARVGRHVQNVRLISADEADQHASEKLRQSSFLSRWRAADAAYRRLIDIELWRRTERVIILDSDVLTTAEPRDVSEWLDHGRRPFMLGQPPHAGQADESANLSSSHVQAQFLQKVPELSAALAKPAAFLQGATAGFCGFFNELSLDQVESALKTALDHGLPMHHWGGDQCLIIYLLSTADAERLPVERYLNFEPALADQARTATMLHFYGTHRFHRLIYPKLAAAVVRRLRLPR